MEQRKWVRPELENERSIVLVDGQKRVCAAYYGIATKEAVEIYLARGWGVFTTAPIKPARKEGAKSDTIGADMPLTTGNVKKSAANWDIHRFPVVVFPENTPKECAVEFRKQAQAQPAQEESIERMRPKAVAEAMRREADDLVIAHNLYLALERTLERTIAPEEVPQIEHIDPEVARKILRHREHVARLRQVFEAIIKAGLNGDFRIIDAYRDIAPPTQPQARLAIDTVIVTVEIMLRLNLTREYSDLARQYPSLAAFELGDIADMGITALFMNNACWGEDDTNGAAEDHAATSAANYIQMRLKMPSLPEVADLIAHHGDFWPHDWVYYIRVVTRMPGDSVADECCKTRYELGNGPAQSKAIEREVRRALALADLTSLGVEYDVNVWPAEPGIILRIAILAIAEQIVLGQQQDGKTLHQIFMELASRLTAPPDKPYTIQANLHCGLHLLSHALAAAATEYQIFSRGAIILFTNTAKDTYSEAAHQVAVDGGIALSLGGAPVELLLISHMEAPVASRILENAATLPEILHPVMGTNGFPKMHLILMAIHTNELIYRHRAMVLAIADERSVRMFLEPYSGLIAQARRLIASRQR